MSHHEVKSAIREVRDQLLLDFADGKYLTHVGDNIGVPRPLFGFSNDSIWRAIVRRLALDYRQIENLFADLLTVYFGPRKTVTSVIVADIVAGEYEFAVVDQIEDRRLPQRGTIVIDENLLDEETIDFDLLDPKTGLIHLNDPLTNDHTAALQNALGTLASDVVATGTSLTLTNADEFPTSGFPYTLLIDAGTDVEEVVQLTAHTLGSNVLTISALANNHNGVREAFITSAFVSSLGSGGVLKLSDTSKFPTSGIVRVEEDGGTPTEDVEFYQNDADNDLLYLKSKISNTYTNAEVTLLRPGARVELAQLQVKGVDWDIFVTEPRKLQIYLPRALQENRLLDVSFLHDQIVGAAPSTTVATGGATAGDTTLKVTDASAFPSAGNIKIDSGGGSEENIGYIRIDRFSTRLAFTHASGVTVLYVADVTPIKAAEELTKQLVLSRGTGNEELVTWTSIDEVNNTITLAAVTTNAHTPARATGSITTDAGASLPSDGDTFTVSDGVTSLTFEFDNNSTVTAGNIPVDITGSPSADDMRDRIVEAINFAPFNINAAGPTAATVDLENQNLGSAGNVTITDTFTPLGAWAFSGMSGGNDEGSVEVWDPNVLHLSRGLANSHAATETVDLDEDEYAGTDLEIGDPTVATVRSDRYQGPYMYSPGNDLAESVETTLAENLAGPAQLLVTQQPPRRSLEVRDASLFDSTGQFDIHVGRGKASSEVLDVADITLRRSVTGLTINANHGSGVSTLTLSALTNLPSTSGYRLLIDEGGANEEIVIFSSFGAGTDINIEGLTTKAHNIGETIELMADVFELSEATTYTQPGLIPFAQRTTVLPGPMTAAGSIVSIEELRDYIDLTSAADFPPAGAKAILNFGRRVVVAESRFATAASAGATALILEDTSQFPTSGYPYFVEIGVDTKEFEQIEVSNNNTTTNTLTISSGLLHNHAVGEYVRYNTGAQRVITFQGTETGGATERLTFDPAIAVVGEQHLENEPVSLSTISLGIPGQRGFDYPFYLPSSWADRLEMIFDLGRAAGVEVVVIDDK